jgi:hypothetical protein
MLVIGLGLVANAQEQFKPFPNDTVMADTNTYISNKFVDGYSNTVVIFAFTKKDVKDSLSVAKIQGSMTNEDGSFIDVTDATGNLTNTSTDGTTILYVENPIHFYYRGFLACATGDTVAVTDPGIYLKKED